MFCGNVHVLSSQTKAGSDSNTPLSYCIEILLQNVFTLSYILTLIFLYKILQSWKHLKVIIF
jgi:hypothetical protein